MKKTFLRITLASLLTNTLWPSDITTGNITDPNYYKLQQGMAENLRAHMIQASQTYHKERTPETREAKKAAIKAYQECLEKNRGLFFYWQNLLMEQYDKNVVREGLRACPKGDYQPVSPGITTGDTTLPASAQQQHTVTPQRNMSPRKSKDGATALPRERERLVTFVVPLSTQDPRLPHPQGPTGTMETVD